MKPASGFTLLELLVVLAIVAAVSTLALAGYEGIMLKARRTEGRAALLELLTQQERHFSQHHSYLPFAPGSSQGDAAPFKTYSGDRPEHSAYLLGAQPCTDMSLQQCVMVYAVPRHEDRAAGVLQAQSNGVRNCTGTDVRSCWK